MNNAPHMPPNVGTPGLWIGFTIFVIVVLLVDLGLFHRKAHDVGIKEALAWTCVWISLALLFNGFIYYRFGSEKALEFLTGYIIEEALSVDNLFVFIVVFSYFNVRKTYQHRVLFWGILGAMIMRAIFIVAGAALLNRFHWIMFIFGGFLVITGFKILFQKSDEIHPDKNWIVRGFRKFIPMSRDFHGQSFFVKENGRLLATPLLLVLVFIEATDVLFAVDSIPAIFAVTRDPLIVYTSNIFAILGLRSMYFVLSTMVDKFRYLKVGLGFVLIFVGIKMLLAEFYKIPVALSLGVIAGLLAMSVAASFLIPEKKQDLNQVSKE